jgi:hypothetical protein
LKPATRAARARIVTTEFLDELLAVVHDAVAAQHPRLRGEASAAFAHDLKRRPDHLDV